MRASCCARGRCTTCSSTTSSRPACSVACPASSASCRRRGSQAILMIGPLGGTALEVRDASAFAPLAGRGRALRAAAAPHRRQRGRDRAVLARVRAPRGRAALDPARAGVRDARRGPVRAADAGRARAGSSPRAQSDAAEITANSARAAPRGPARRPRRRRRGRLPRAPREATCATAAGGSSRERGRIVFQVHVGAASAQRGAARRRLRAERRARARPRDRAACAAICARTARAPRRS